MKFCTKCGQQMPDDALFCSHCGAGVGSPQSETPNMTNKNEIPPKKKGKKFFKKWWFWVIIGVLVIAIMAGSGDSTDTTDDTKDTTNVTTDNTDNTDDNDNNQNNQTEDDKKQTIVKIPDIWGLPLDEAEQKLKNAHVQYELVYNEAVLNYDDIAPRPSVLGIGEYHWNEEENFNYIYEGEKITVTVNAPAIYITSVAHDINSVGGVNISIDVVNNSEKVIKYIKFNNVEFYNTVGDPAYCSIKNSYKRTLTFTGPLNAGESESIYWEAVMYNNKTSALVFRTITVDFMDGTSQTIKYDAYWWDSRYVGGYPG